MEGGNVGEGGGVRREDCVKLLGLEEEASLELDCFDAGYCGGGEQGGGGGGDGAGVRG